MRVRGVYASGGMLNEWGTKYSSASIRSSISSSSSSRLWKNLLSLGLGSFMRSSPWGKMLINYYINVAGVAYDHDCLDFCNDILDLALLYKQLKPSTNKATTWQFSHLRELFIFSKGIEKKKNKNKCQIIRQTNKILLCHQHRPTWMTRYLWGSRAIRVNSAASSLNLGRLSASIIQPERCVCVSGQPMWGNKYINRYWYFCHQLLTYNSTLLRFPTVSNPQ